MAIIALLLVASGLGPGLEKGPPPIDVKPEYTLRLDIVEPEKVLFTMRVLAKEIVLVTPQVSAPLRSPPTCRKRPLVALSAHRWLKPSGCDEVSWTGAISRLDASDFDASRPRTFWSEPHELWFLSGDLPWMRYERQSWTPVHVIAKGRNGIVANDTSLSGADDRPVYIIVGQAERRYQVGLTRTEIYGDIPERPQAERLQRVVAATLERWQRDLLPDDVTKRDRFNYLWVAGADRAEPGFFASTGSDGILMQFTADRTDRHPYAKLDAGILLTGAHEGFHELAGKLADLKPTWVNESWASYFAYATARNVLTGPALATAQRLFEEPADISVFRAQRLLDAGDGSSYGVFYAKGGRFWAAIDRVLTNRPNSTGRLAALLKRTRGMQGVDWRSPSSIAAFLDLHTAGRANRIVKCYLVEDRCPESGPITS